MNKFKNIRFISKRNIEEAYRREEDLDKESLDIREEDHFEKIDRIPEETFEIIGKVVSFIQLADSIKGEKDEN